MSAFEAGSIWKATVDFGVGDGVRDKFFVLLNSWSDSPKHLLAAFTTSNSARYSARETSKQCGCPAAPCYRVEVGQVTCFPVKTWIQFDNVHPTRPDALEQRRAAGTAKHLLDLPTDLLFSVLHCAKKSNDLTGEKLAMIETTLKRLEQERERARKAKPPTKASAPPPPPSPPSSALTIESLRTELARCGKCEAELCDLLGIPVEDLVSGLAGPLDERFVAEIHAGVELLGGKAPQR